MTFDDPEEQHMAELFAEVISRRLLNELPASHDVKRAVAKIKALDWWGDAKRIAERSNVDDSKREPTNRAEPK